MIRFKLTGDSSSLESAAKRGKRSMEDLKAEFRSGITTIAKWTAATIAAGAALTTALVVKSMSAVDAQNKLARSLNATYDGVTAVQKAAAEGGIDGMDKSLNRLNRRLGAAQMGTGAALKAVEALNLDLERMSQLDADEKIALIADRINEMNVSNQQAARYLQDLGFEQKEAVDFFRQGGDSILSYRKRIEELGLSLDDVDARKIEQANDAMAIFGDVLKGVGQTLAVEVAPIITAIAKLFEDATRASGGFGDETKVAFSGVMEVSYGVINVVGAIGRTFEGVAQGVTSMLQGVQYAMAKMADVIFNGPVRATNKLIETLNRVPGVDIEPVSLGEFGRNIEMQLEIAERTFEIGWDNMKRIVSDPLPGTAFRGFVDEARAAAEESASIAQQMREEMISAIGAGEGGDDGKDTSEAEQKKLEQQRAQLEARIEAIREANLSERELLMEKQEQELADLEAFYAGRQELEDEWLERSRDTKRRHEEELTELEQRAADKRNRLQQKAEQDKARILGNAWSGLTTLMNSESRKMFEIGKVAAIAQSLVATWQGASEALKLGWPLGPIAAASITAAGLANVANIRSQSFNSGGGGSTGGAASVTESINAQGTAVQGVGDRPRSVIEVRGLDDGQLFSGGQVRTLMDQINEEMRNGAELGGF